MAADIGVIRVETPNTNGEARNKEQGQQGNRWPHYLLWKLDREDGYIQNLGSVLKVAFQIITCPQQRWNLSLFKEVFASNGGMNAPRGTLFLTLIKNISVLNNYHKSQTRGKFNKNVNLINHILHANFNVHIGLIHIFAWGLLLWNDFGSKQSREKSLITAVASLP